jgi:hypothetical protein
MNGFALVYAQQDPLKKKNDLTVLNDVNNYSDSGLTLGTKEGSNLRLSYNTENSYGSLDTNAFKIKSSQFGLTGIPASNPNATNSYLLIDPSGNVTKGNSQFPGDINVMLSHIQNDLFVTETTLNNLSFMVSNLDSTKINKSVQTNTTWIYMIAGLVGIVFIGLVVFLILWILDKNKVHHSIRHTNNQMEKVTTTLHEMSIYLKELKQQVPTQSSPPEFSGKRFLMSHIKDLV